MILFYSILVLLVLLTIYFFVFPLFKKRPVLIRSQGLVAYGVTLILLFFLFFPSMIFLTATVLVLFSVLLYKPWFLYGVPQVKVGDALEKAALRTRTPIEKISRGYKIDSTAYVQQYRLISDTYVIVFGIRNGSKKAQLTKEVFRKFIQNYFI